MHTRNITDQQPKPGSSKSDSIHPGPRLITSASAKQPSAAATDAWIFRNGQSNISGQELLSYISDALSSSDKDRLTDALIVAGEFEAGLADGGHNAAAEAVRLTDALASALCTSDPQYLAEAHELLGYLHVPEQIGISPPEGFTYYALHPLQFANATARLVPERCVFAIIGIRSIGTTLSAIVAASLKQAGQTASRITVRPKGHPYSRETSFSAAQQIWIHQQVAAGAQFLVVDEGPGRSGSTFLSVAEALLQAGVSHKQILLLGSRQPNPDELLAQDAARRWAQFRFVLPVSSSSTRFTDHVYAGGGCWRSTLIPTNQQWPESWTQMERLKFISPDRKTLFKFEGMGRIGAGMRDRAVALAKAGFSPDVSDAGDGFLAYSLAPGRALGREDVSSQLLQLMGRYCAFRAANFTCSDASPSELKSMVEFNVMQQFGIEIQLSEDTFASSNPVTVDGRMQPHEWITDSPNGVFKTDAISHGDDHFFPGPCDIAWDLAGTAVEWQLGQGEISYLIESFERTSGLHGTTRRLPAYMLAYSVFRFGFCKMASGTVGDLPEQARLLSSCLRYRRVAEQLLSENFVVHSALRAG